MKTLIALCLLCAACFAGVSFGVGSDFECAALNRVPAYAFNQSGVTVSIAAKGGTFSTVLVAGSMAIVPDENCDSESPVAIVIESSRVMDSLDFTLTQLDPLVTPTIAFGYKNPKTGLIAFGPAGPLIGTQPDGSAFRYGFSVINLVGGAILTGVSVDDLMFAEYGR